MKNIYLFALMIALVGISGCGSLRTSQYSSPVSSTVEANLKANVEVGSKIHGKATSTTLFWLFTFGPDTFVDGVNYGVATSTNSGLFSGFFGDKFTEVKEAAAYDAVSKAGADLIIAPKYTVEYNNYLILNITKASVSGYKGTIKSIQPK
jgi:uncharacterized protein YceK